jgi:hypothetical protein
VRKLGGLADNVPRDLADAFIMFAKTDALTDDEIALAQTLNDQYRKRVIIWSREELEPYHVYERSRPGSANGSTRPPSPTWHPSPTSCGLSQVDERSLEAAYIGERAGLLLVELPRESLSGRWRVWVPKSAVA